MAPDVCSIESWFLAGKNPRGYAADAGHLKSKRVGTTEFATLMQELSAKEPPASEWIGKRLRFRAEVRVEDVEGRAALWMRIDGKQTSSGKPEMLAFDDMWRRPIVGTETWMRHDVVLDVPEAARTVAFGLSLSGDGEAWVRHATLELVPAETPTTDRTPSFISHWIKEENLKPFLTALGWITRYDFGADDWTAVYYGVRDTDAEHGGWYEYPFSDTPRASVRMSRDGGSGVVLLEVDVADWQRREVELAIQIFAEFTIAGASFSAD